LAVCFNSMSLPPDQELVENHERKPILDTELSWDILKELESAERHLNNLETDYRRLASMGFILKGNPVNVLRSVRKSLLLGLEDDGDLTGFQPVLPPKNMTGML
jgi:hypothetical protein